MLIAKGMTPTSLLISAQWGVLGYRRQMKRIESVAQESYISPELAYCSIDPDSLFMSVSINEMDIYPQVDEYVQEEATEIEF